MFAETTIFRLFFALINLVDMPFFRILLLLVVLLLPAKAATQMSLEELPTKEATSKKKAIAPPNTGPRYKNKRAAARKHRRRTYLPKANKPLVGPAYKNRKPAFRPAARMPRVVRSVSSPRYKNRGAKRRKL